MGIMVYSILWVMQDVNHQQELCITAIFLPIYCSQALTRNPKTLTPKPLKPKPNRGSQGFGFVKIDMKVFGL